MALHKVRINYPSVTETFSNTIFINNPGNADAADVADAVRAALLEFFNDPAGAAPISVSQLFSPEIDPASCNFDMYNQPIAGGPTGSPIETRTLPIDDNPLSSTALPGQPGVGLSFHADLTGVPEELVVGGVTTRPAQRRRGHITIGPVNSGTMTGAPARVTDDVRQALVDAADAFMASSHWNATGVSWVVYSDADNAARDVVGGFVDNGWETQRRRLPEPTARSTWGT